MTKVQRKSLLTLIELLPKEKGKSRKGRYQCECGVIKDIFVSNVNRLHTTTCGCSHVLSERHSYLKHPLYRIWANIKTRCTNPNRPEAYLYYGKGVRMCEEWLNSPKLFIEWALANGWKKGMVIDKDKKALLAGIEPLLYSPEWCSVLTADENQNEKSTSRKIEYNGIVRNVMEWAALSKATKATFWYRMKNCEFDMYKYMAKWGDIT